MSIATAPLAAYGEAKQTSPTTHVTTYVHCLDNVALKTVKSQLGHSSYSYTAWKLVFLFSYNLSDK